MRTFIVFIVSCLMLIHSSLVFGFTGWKLGTAEDGSAFAYNIQNKPETHGQVRLFVLRSDGFPVLIISFKPFNPTTERLEKVKEALGPTRLIIDDKEIANYKKTTWRKAENNTLRARLILSKQAIQGLKSGKKLKVLVLVAGVDKEYDPSLEFQLEGLSRLMSEVLN